MKFKRRHRCILYLLITCVVAFWSSRPCMGLVVSEVMYHPAEEAGMSVEDEALEFIELYNNRAVFEDLSGYAFTNGIEYTFEAGTIIGPKEYLVVARNPATLEAAYGIDNVYGPFSGRLSNDGERIELSNGNGEIIISFRYDDKRPWPISPDGTGHSLIRAKLSGDPEEGSSWTAGKFIGGTPGEPDEVQVEPEDPTIITLVDVGHPGRYFKGTQEPSASSGGQATTAWTEPGFDDTPGRTGWLDGPSGYGYSNDQAELATINTILTDMQGGYTSVYARLRFTLTANQIASLTQLRSTVHYDDAYVLYLNGVEISRANVSGDPPPFSAQGDAAATDYSPDTRENSSWISLLVPGTNVLAIQGHNTNPQNSSDFVLTAELDGVIVPFSGGDNTDARIVINELLANSDSGAGTDWIELYNPGPVPVDLSNVYLSDNCSNLLKYKFPDGLVLSPGEFWPVGEGTPPDGFEFALSSSGETVYVTVGTSGPDPEPIRVLDAVRYEAMEPDVTFGRFPDGSDYFSVLSSATFNSSNAHPRVDDIVINEIMYNHAMRDERYEYIELYNRGTSTVSLGGWAFTDGIEYEFDDNVQMSPGSYLVIAKDPEFIENVYDNLIVGSNLFGPYQGQLSDRSERIRLSCPLEQEDPQTGELEVCMVTEDEVTYYEGGRWPSWADGYGASLELRDPRSNNDSPDAWADSDESSKATWQPFSFTINSNDSDYTHDRVTIYDLMLLNRGEILLDDLQLIIGGGSNRLSNGSFESGVSGWRILGNHVQSFVTTDDSHYGSRSLHLISTGHGDPGANRINRSITGINATSVTLSGWARWLRGSRFLLLRTSRELAPVQPPRPSHAFELDMPLDLGTPGMQNTAFVSNRGPDILEVQHNPVLPAGGEPIVVIARVTDNDDVGIVTLYYRSETSSGFTSTTMVDNGTGNDLVAGDSIYSGTIPGASNGTMRAFYIVASDLGSPVASTQFPSLLQSTADVPDRTCLVRVGDTLINSPFAAYRIWLSNDVIDIFRSRANLSNELMDCTFVYNDTEVFYNTRIRFRGSPWLRPGSGWSPRDRHAYRIDFNPDQRFRAREEINLDNTEGESRGPLQERASYWFYKQMGLQFSMQEYIRLIINGNNHNKYEDVQKIDGDYINGWFPDDADGRIHKVDDYFEYSSNGTSHRNLDEGLIYNSSHPLLNETYRWGFEKRSHPEDDNWDRVFDLAVALNTPSNSIDYEEIIESVLHPEQFARVLALRHAVGDWDSYGFERGKNNYFYYAPIEGKWYFLPWDIDFTLGSGRSATHDLFAIAGYFPEVRQFLNYPKYRRMYLQAFAELVNGPWQTSYGTNNPPTAFDIFLDDAADALMADGSEDRRRNGIKQFVRDRRNYILTQIPSLAFEITTNNGQDFCTSDSMITINGQAPLEVSGISVNGTPVEAEFNGNNEFELNVPVQEGSNVLTLQGLNSLGNSVSWATDSITVTRIGACMIRLVSPNQVQNNGTVQLTIYGSGFQPGTETSVTLKNSTAAVGFNALYVRNNRAFDSIDDATSLLDNPDRGIGSPVYASHEVINLLQTGDEGLFAPSDQFAPPFNSGDPDNFAVRFTGYVLVPSPGTRYFGVNSDDGFILWVNNFLIGEYAVTRAPATTDCTQGRTAGTMSYNFRSAGTYFMELHFYENSGGEEIEFFQTNSSGGDRRLINDGSELVVLRDEAMEIYATDVVVVDEDTITCRVDLSGAEPGSWTIYVTPECGEAAQCHLDNAINIIDNE